MSGLQKVECGLYTMCLVQDEDRVLLVNRPDKLGFLKKASKYGPMNCPSVGSFSISFPS
ncbi:hypothetical protein WJ0W_002733 [Paenibacillus melissococcoides]|uniref:Nudix hydrolase domain-containing protein n=1 Tax=Paenibacillus melissococcoides TaxID=2912268 RepID=A0ABM9G1P8_9BACL|nr:MULTISPECIES: hypothetical protein [Paenibacillus]MEB9898091.1 hypothetical protein [Bacillus cereus]CAH8245498.1 hypothetical protein WJ0W_002733 [Paenibacillus melissococcoides]CAH8711123.1 hypothetical protein WDD9_002812 [Paenibacillus melissococcoides]CAH8711889.1 hypothetical protein HTL2_003113 [Paenibacillus melissococcoides]GIO82078.1 hypothetical protein J6TS7_56880 [Paenibacillus dendritiformis]